MPKVKDSTILIQFYFSFSSVSSSTMNFYVVDWNKKMKLNHRSCFWAQDFTKYVKFSVSERCVSSHSFENQYYKPSSPVWQTQNQLIWDCEKWRNIKCLRISSRTVIPIHFLWTKIERWAQILSNVSRTETLGIIYETTINQK